MTLQAYQYAGGAGTIAIPNASISSPRSPTTSDTYTSNGNAYQIGQYWSNTTTGFLYLYLGDGIWDVISGAGVGPIDTITGNTGGAIGPTAGNINIVGAGTTTITGSGSTITISPSVSGYPITPYVVGPVGKAGYQTIQSAVTAATVAGGGTVFVQPGSYTENLIFASTVTLLLLALEGVTITGIHSISNSTSLTVDGFNLVSATDIFTSSAIIGFVPLTCKNCSIACNGYIFNTPTWITGTTITLSNCSDFNSTVNKIVNDVGGAAILMEDCSFTAGGTFPVAGTITFNNSTIEGPVAFTGARITANTTFFEMPITFDVATTGSFVDCSFLAPGTGPAIVNSSGDPISIINSIVECTTSPAIGGTSAGVLSLGDITFTSNFDIAATLTVAYLPVRLSPVFKVATASGASPQTANGRVGAVTFTGVSIASGASQTFVISNTSITGAGTHILYSMTGITAGSALSIVSVTNAANQSTIVVTNGTSATMVTSVANLTFTFIVLD